MLLLIPIAIGIIIWFLLGGLRSPLGLTLFIMSIGWMIIVVLALLSVR
jgi:hypothetical protein